MIIIAVFIAVVGGLIVVKFQPKFAYIVAAIYFAGIVYFTFVQRMSMPIENVFEPFLTWKKLIRGAESFVLSLKDRAFYDSEILQVLRDAALNVLMFVPFGYLLPTMVPFIDSAWKILALGFIFSLMIEIMQQSSKLGMLDVFDIAFNTTGALWGWKLYKYYVNT